MDLRMDTVSSAVGTLVVVAGDHGLVALEFDACEERLHAMLVRRFGEVRLTEVRDPLGASGRLAAYLGGDLTAIDALPVNAGGTPFQRRVWSALREIPPGTTSSYGALASRLGAPGASRAVGLANSQNPVAIVVPCHRVIGASGALTGYAGGLDRKRWLLAHEGALLL